MFRETKASAVNHKLRHVEDDGLARTMTNKAVLEMQEVNLDTCIRPHMSSTSTPAGLTRPDSFALASEHSAGEHVARQLPVAALDAALETTNWPNHWEH
jgi:hypothetical protein